MIGYGFRRVGGFRFKVGEPFFSLSASSSLLIPDMAVSVD